MIKLNLDLFEISINYYRSRMMRILNILKPGEHNTEELWGSYKMAAKNRLERDYQISQSNGFELIMDKNLEGTDAYFDLLSGDCIDD